MSPGTYLGSLGVDLRVAEIISAGHNFAQPNSLLTKNGADADPVPPPPSAKMCIRGIEKQIRRPLQQEVNFVQVRQVNLFQLC